MPLKSKDLILDNYYREGIVLKRAKCPTKDWINKQQDTKVKEFDENTVWWEVIPLDGGLVIIPEPLARFIREATYDDIMKAVDHANKYGRIAIAEAFPEILEEANRRLYREKEDLG